MKNTTINSLVFILFLILISKSNQISDITTIIGKVSKTKEEKLDKKKKTLTFKTDLKVSGNTEIDKFKTKELIAKGKSEIKGSLTTKTLNSNEITSNETETTSIISNTGILTIIGNIVIDEKSFINKNEDSEINKKIKSKFNLNGDSYKVNGVKQWSVIQHDDFESKNSIKGWSQNKTSSCKKNGNVFLGGHCKLSYGEVTKKFYIDIPHKQVRVTASFHMLDNWEGEFGYMKINKKIVWIKEGRSDVKNGINFCGGKDNDAAFNLPIDAYVNHDSQEIEITFGSTLQKDPCEASFGVDDVMIYVK